MSTNATDLAVRGHERYQCNVPAVLAVHSEHAKLIRLDKSAPGAGGPASVHIVDLSMGGVGLRSPLFFPLSTRLVLHLTPPSGDVSHAIPLSLRVQRVMMLDRSPAYYLGTAFEGLAPEHAAVVSELLDGLRASGAKLVPEKPRA